MRGPGPVVAPIASCTFLIHNDVLQASVVQLTAEPVRARFAPTRACEGIRAICAGCLSRRSSCRVVAGCDDTRGISGGEERVADCGLADLAHLPLGAAKMPARAMHRPIHALGAEIALRTAHARRVCRLAPFRLILPRAARVLKSILRVHRTVVARRAEVGRARAPRRTVVASRACHTIS